MINLKIQFNRAWFVPCERGKEAKYILGQSQGHDEEYIHTKCPPVITVQREEGAWSRITIEPNIGLGIKENPV